MFVSPQVKKLKQKLKSRLIDILDDKGHLSKTKKNISFEEDREIDLAIERRLAFNIIDHYAEVCLNLEGYISIPTATHPKEVKKSWWL